MKTFNGVEGKDSTMKEDTMNIQGTQTRKPFGCPGINDEHVDLLGTLLVDRDPHFFGGAHEDMDETFYKQLADEIFIEKFESAATANDTRDLIATLPKSEMITFIMEAMTSEKDTWNLWNGCEEKFSTNTYFALLDILQIVSNHHTEEI